MIQTEDILSNMLHLVIFSLFVSSTAAAAATGVTGDMNCTYMLTGVPVFSPVAFACSDNAGAPTCQQFFNAGAAVTAPYDADDTGTTNRPTGCYQTTTPAAPSTDIKNSAVQLCPKFCGFCCQTPAYNCPNAPYPQLDCSKVTQQQCKDPSWTTVLASNCPNVCGFCQNGGCTDAVNYCGTQPTICTSSGLQAFVAANCQRTCGLCSPVTTVSSVTTTKSSVSSTCGNTNANCANWVANGFCSSTFYTTAQKMQYCGTSCGLCSGKK